MHKISNEKNTAELKKKLLFSLVGLLLFYGIIEAVSFFSLTVLSYVHPHYVTEVFVQEHFDVFSEEDRQKYVKHAFHPILGWDNRPLERVSKRGNAGITFTANYDADGSRSDGLPPSPLLVNTYGDSFTHGNDVEGDQTWQYYLETRIGHEVKNYGVAGYGPQQALLKLKGHAKQGVVAPITILGLWAENINRIVNPYVPFNERQKGGGGAIAFRPAYRANGAGIKVVKNYYDDPQISLERLRELALLASADDFWAQRLHFSLRYPYSVNFFRFVFYKADWKVRQLMGRPLNMYLWDTDEGRSVMIAALDEFARLTREAGSVPVVLFIPYHTTVRFGTSPLYSNFKRLLSAHNKDLLVVDVMDQELDREKFFFNSYSGHTSPYGNQVIAEAILKKICPLLPKSNPLSCQATNGTRAAISK